MGKGNANTKTDVPRTGREPISMLEAVARQVEGQGRQIAALEADVETLKKAKRSK